MLLLFIVHCCSLLFFGVFSVKFVVHCCYCHLLAADFIVNGAGVFFVLSDDGISSAQVVGGVFGTLFALLLMLVAALLFR